MENLVHVVEKILSIKGIKYTDKFVRDSILSHPDYPSLLSVSDTLEKYKIDVLAIKIDDDKLNQVPTPFVAQVHNNNNDLFYTIEDVCENEIICFDDSNKLMKIKRKDFLKQWTGVGLLLEASKESKEPNIDKVLYKRNFQKVLLGIISVSLVIFGAMSLYNGLHTNFNLLIATGSYIFLKIIGLIVGVFLLWFEIDQYNPTLQSFCTSGANSKINCNAVLTSKYAKLFDGNISLSILSFSYFLGTLSFLLFSNFNKESVAILAFFSFLTLPVIIVSIYSQAFVIKQWCKFCMLIQGVLILEITIAVFSNFYRMPIKTYTNGLLLLILLLTPIVVWLLIKPLLEQEKETNLYKRGLKKLKNNPIVLQGLLQKSRKIKTPTKGLGITIVNPKAKYSIIKVCNPYCNPCAKAHPILEGLVQQGKINLQILFTATTDKEDYKAKPVAHFLAIDEQGDSNKTQEALNNWYLAEEKNYEKFASKFSMNNGMLLEQNVKIEAMSKWCEDENITHTPTIFINGYELPKEYRVEDLRDVLL